MEIPGYILGSRLGQGVYSHVFSARSERQPQREFAVKILKQEHRQDDWVLDGFRREGRIGAAVKHPSLISVHASGYDQTPFHVTSRVRGYTLENAALLPQSFVLRIVAQIADALTALHNRGFVHGDLKPANIMLAPDGHATLIDLGFARKAGTIPFGDGLPGTPNYLAPELCRRDFVDTPAADVFALGVTAFELLTGQFPYKRLESNEEVLLQHRNEHAGSLRDVDQSLPQETVKLVNAMTRHDLFARIKLYQVVSVLKAQSTIIRRAA